LPREGFHPGVITLLHFFLLASTETTLSAQTNRHISRRSTYTLGRDSSSHFDNDIVLRECTKHRRPYLSTEGMEGRASGGGLRRAEQGSLFGRRRIIAVDRINRVDRRARGGRVNCGRCGRRGHEQPPVTRPPPDDLSRA